MDRRHHFIDRILLRIQAKNYIAMWKVFSQAMHVQHDSRITSVLKVLAKVKVFVHASHMDTSAMTLALHLSWLAKKNL